MNRLDENLPVVDKGLMPSPVLHNLGMEVHSFSISPLDSADRSKISSRPEWAMGDPVSK